MLSEIRDELDRIAREEAMWGLHLRTRDRDRLPPRPDMPHLEALRSVRPHFIRYARTRRHYLWKRAVEEAQRRLSAERYAEAKAALQKRQESREREKRRGWFWRLFVGT